MIGAEIKFGLRKSSGPRDERRVRGCTKDGNGHDAQERPAWEIDVRFEANIESACLMEHSFRRRYCRDVRV